MRWQKLLNKKDMKHLRWAGTNMTLTGFKALRVGQRRLEEQAETRGTWMIACSDCNRIEYKLKQGGKL